MYKHKDKLKSNTVELSLNDVLYKEGMTVSELASALSLGVGEVIKKLMSLGLMMNLNQSIDFDTASIISGDVGKVLKREEATNEVTFEELEIVDDISNRKKKKRLNRFFTLIFFLMHKLLK